MLQRILIIALALMLGACASNRHQVKQETAGVFGVYGNWCGPDHPKVMDPPPDALDLLDASCMRHDYCYVEKGYLNCDCDKDLVKDIKHNLRARKYNAEQRKFAVSIANYFKGSPCENTKPADAPQQAEESVVNKVLNTTKSGIGKFIDLLGGDEAQAAPAEPGAGGSTGSEGAAEENTPADPEQQPLSNAPASKEEKIWY